jgi:hypothetical protein
MSDNMKLWDAVSKTDPLHTKKVNQRGGFTAIDAHYQIESATRQFGPIGIGWGYTAGEPIFNEGAIIIPVTLWHGDRSNIFGPIYGCAQMFGQRLDTDAPKKATTDALTKGLSQIGFNADVFLGKFDDNKYVAERSKESAAQAVSSGLQDAWADSVLDGLPKGATARQTAEAFARQIESDFKSKTGETALLNEWERRGKIIARLRVGHEDLWSNLVEVYETTLNGIKEAA